MDADSTFADASSDMSSSDVSADAVVSALHRGARTLQHSGEDPDPGLPAVDFSADAVDLRSCAQATSSSAGPSRRRKRAPSTDRSVNEPDAAAAAASAHVQAAHSVPSAAAAASDDSSASEDEAPTSASSKPAAGATDGAPMSIAEAMQLAKRALRKAKKLRVQQQKKRQKSDSGDPRWKEEHKDATSSSPAAPSSSNSLIVAAVSPAAIEAAFSTPSFDAPAPMPSPGWGESTGSRSKKKNKKKNAANASSGPSAAALAVLAAQHETDVKYWVQRYTYFSLWDRGCRLDRVGWFSVTPERIAAHQSERCRCDTIIDAYAGVGGNTIQFAMQCAHVVAIEIDPTRLEILRHNARIYGVEDRIEYICGDFLQLLPGLKADVVFLAPPWGGVEYSNVEYFDIRKQIVPDGMEIFQRARAITDNIAYCLPRNILKEQVRAMAGLPGLNVDGQVDATRAHPLACELEENCVSGKVKMMTAYFGALVDLPPQQPMKDAGPGEQAEQDGATAMEQDADVDDS